MFRERRKSKGKKKEHLTDSRARSGFVLMSVCMGMEGWEKLGLA